MSEIKKRMLLYIISSVGISGILYITLHEGGHAIVAVTCGATITEFSIVKAHMSYQGGEFDIISLSFLHIAGLLLPYICALIYLIAYNRRYANIKYRILSMMIAVTGLSPMIAWIIIPLVYMSGSGSSNDDVVKFLMCSGIHPLVVTGLAIMITALSVIVVCSKGVVQNFVVTIKAIRDQEV